jgi:hypothetical protein
VVVAIAQLSDILHTDYKDMLVLLLLLFTVASRYYNYFTDGSANLGNYGLQERGIQHELHLPT